MQEPPPTNETTPFGDGSSASAPHRLSRRKKLLFAGVLAIAVLAILEATARVFFPQPRPTGAVVEDNRLGWVPAKFEPLSVGPKTAGETRILLLGDSFAFGAGVDGRGKAFVGVMERILRERHPAWSVVNAGVLGWGPVEERRFLEYEGRRLAPDVVLVQIYLGNDITDATGLTRMAVFQGMPILASRIATPTGRLLSWARIHSRLLHVLCGAVSNAPLLLARHRAALPFPDTDWRSLMKRRPWLEGEFYSISKGADPFYEAGLDALLENLRRIGAMSRSLGARPMAMLIPGRLQAVKSLCEYAFKLNGIDPSREDLDKFNRRIAPVLRSEGFAVFDLLPPMGERPHDASLLYHTGPDDHFNAEGHRFAGEAVAQWIEETNSSHDHQ